MTPWKDLFDFITGIVKLIKNDIKSALIVFVFLVLLLFIAVGYEYRASIAKPLIERFSNVSYIYRLDQTKFNVEISGLVKRSKASGASLWIVDVGGNKKKMVYRYDAATGKEDTTFYNDQFPLFYEDVNSIAFMNVVRSEISCTNLKPETAYGDFLLKSGITFICFAPIPPEPGQFVGMIELEYKQKPQELVLSEQTNNPAKRITFENRLRLAAKNILKKETK